MIEAAVRRDRTIVVLGLLAVITLCWLYIVSGAGMHMQPSMSMPDGMVNTPFGVGWSSGYLFLIFVMWWIMMVAMMLPSAAPMILLFATVNRNTNGAATDTVPAVVFVSGYLLVWGLFSVLASLAQWSLTSFDLMDSMMKGSSTVLNGTLLVLAGIYQFTPVKEACLSHCRSPIQFVMGHWMPGLSGALKMGLVHGLFCLGCCWFLMGLLFFGGVMNMAWIAGLAIYVLIEKVVPNGNLVGRVAGYVLVIWGGYLITGALLASPGLG